MADITSVLIVGAGQMGNGIAHVAALAGKTVTLCDSDDERVAHAMATIERNMSRQVAGGKLSQDDKQAALARIAAGSLSDAASADIVIEAVSESFAVKQSVYAGLRQHMRGDALLASNTSSIPITRLAAASGVADNFVGLHFFNPVPVMKLLEIIRGLQTSDATYAKAKVFGEQLGKVTVVSSDSPAFIANRILLPMINEAVFTLQEGIGSVADIDTAMKLGMRHPMGPLQLADYIGLDTCLAVLDVLVEGTGDPKYRPAPLLRTYVQAGWLGVKSGKGFYDYSVEPAAPSR